MEEDGKQYEVVDGGEEDGQHKYKDREMVGAKEYAVQGEEQEIGQAKQIKDKAQQIQYYDVEGQQVQKWDE
ncbi:hypothetical protein H0H92_006737 [Tricholoma furcatifolium]|nr:hypothetical protein H0H92_006737 [Tricholoma furcatifolium]